MASQTSPCWPRPQQSPRSLSTEGPSPAQSGGPEPSQGDPRWLGRARRGSGSAPPHPVLLGTPRRGRLSGACSSHRSSLWGAPSVQMGRLGETSSPAPPAVSSAPTWCWAGRAGRGAKRLSRPRRRAAQAARPAGAAACPPPGALRPSPNPLEAAWIEPELRHLWAPGRHGPQASAVLLGSLAGQRPAPRVPRGPGGSAQSCSWRAAGGRGESRAPVPAPLPCAHGPGRRG